MYMYVGVRPSEKAIHYLCAISQRHIQKLITLPSPIQKEAKKKKKKRKKIDNYSLFYLPQKEKYTVA